MELTEFLLARLDEDERLAGEQDLERVGDPYSDGSGIANRDGFPSYPWGSEGTELQFMAGPGHPSRVLAEVAARRRIVEMHTPKGRTGLHLCPVCVSWEMWLSQEPGGALPLDDAPCDTLRLLALPYAEHPDYRQEWKP